MNNKVHEPFVYRPPTPEQYRAMRGMTRAEKIAYIPFNVTRAVEAQEYNKYPGDENEQDKSTKGNVGGGLYR